MHSLGLVFAHVWGQVGWILSPHPDVSKTPVNMSMHLSETSIVGQWTPLDTLCGEGPVITFQAWGH